MNLQQYLDHCPGIAEWIEQCNIQQITGIEINAETAPVDYLPWMHHELTGNYTVTLHLAHEITRKKYFTHAELFGEAVSR